MDKPSAFDQRHIKTITTERRDILEELHLPPQVISFLRQNARSLQVGAVCLVLAILGWTAYSHWAEVRRDRAAALLAQALETPAGEAREKLLVEVQTKYDGTDAALWSRVQMGHAAMAAGDHQAAIQAYQEVLDNVSTGNPMVPLLHYSLGRAYENSNGLEKAEKQYQQLAAIPGFADQAHLSLGRIYELQNKPEKALAEYEQVASAPAGAGAGQEYIQDRIARLREQTGKTAPAQP